MEGGAVDTPTYEDTNVEVASMEEVTEALDEQRAHRIHLAEQRRNRQLYATHAEMREQKQAVERARTARIAAEKETRHADHLARLQKRLEARKKNEELQERRERRIALREARIKQEQTADILDTLEQQKRN
ncbi:hypothetical protein KIPB_004761, partial [Kipferlia bialata]|eukprot:g4761.t1